MNRRWAIPLMGGCILLGCASLAAAQTLPITLTKVRDLNFGFCDSVPGAVYIVDATEAPGASACTGAYSGRYLVEGDANARIRITVDRRTDITNGTDSLRARLTPDPDRNARLDANGQLTIYVGGRVRFQAGGVSTYGLYIGPADITVEYR